MNMFADIKTIKKLNLKVVFENPIFPQNTSWKLEELNLDVRAWSDEFAVSCKQFLRSQKSSLKTFRHEYSVQFCNFIMHNLPDMELLHLRIRSDKNICEELLPNEKLKSLSLTSFPDDGGFSKDDKVLETILHQYNNIQYLNIRPFGNRMMEDLYEGNIQPKNVELPNLTHLSFNGFVGSFLHGVKMPNLKYMEINTLLDGEDYFDDTELPDDNFPNVEKLSVHGLFTKSIISIIEKCPKLQHLNMSEFNEYDLDFEDSENDDDFYDDPDRISLKTFVDKVPQLKTIGLLNNRWEVRIEKTFKKLNRNVTIKMYNCFDDMMYEFWPLNMIGDYQYHMEKFILYNCLSS